MVSVIPELKGRFLNFSDDPLFSTFTGNGKVGSNYGIRMVVKKPEKHMVTFTLSCTFLDPFTREKRSLFLKRRVELIIDFRSLPWHQETVFWHYCGAEK